MEMEVLKKSPLFNGIEDKELEALLSCLSAREKTVLKNEYVFRFGERASCVGVVCSGAVQVIKEDFWGNRTMISKLEEGDLFGEAFACAGEMQLPVSVVAVKETHLLLADYKKIVESCPNSCQFHTRLIENMLRILARKNILLTQKAEHMSKKNTREKLFSYLSAQANECRSSSFEIPYNRQELADYLGVDRSAMSTELGKMKAEGILDYNKNRFILKRRI